ncbi:MAG: hypothetical protein MZV65_25185 [Chromatiales bacterium]|nr:hypothetical protein [Chromatiales bacterium]
MRRPRFLHGNQISKTTELRDIEWISPGGGAMSDYHWQEPKARCFGMLLAGDAGEYFTLDGYSEIDDTLLVILNASSTALPFRMPTVRGASYWRCLLDTMRPQIGGWRTAGGYRRRFSDGVLDGDRIRPGDGEFRLNL